jgi:hypothetical protein
MALPTIASSQRAYSSTAIAADAVPHIAAGLFGYQHFMT